MKPAFARTMLPCALALACAAAAGPARGSGAPLPVLTPAPAPEFRVRDLAGRTQELRALLANGPVLLDFWATWCEPCRASIPELREWAARYGARGLTVLGVSVDGPRNIAKVRPFVARMRMTYPVVLDDDGRLQQLYQVTQMPTTVLIARDGTIAATRVGHRTGEHAFMDRLESLLAPEPPAAAPDTTAR